MEFDFRTYAIHVYRGVKPHGGQEGTVMLIKNGKWD